MPLRGLNSSEMTVLVGFIFNNTYASIYKQNMLRNLKAQLIQFTDQENKSKKYLTVETNIFLYMTAIYHIS